MVIVVLGLLLITPFYFQWQSKIPETFQWLLNSKRITDDENLKQKYLKFLTRYQRTLHHQPFRYCFSFFLCIFVIVFNIMNPYYLDNIQNGLSAGAMIAIIKRVFALLFWGYLSGLIVWPVFATGYHIYKLSKHFEFVVHPRHPDRCGGLKPLGDFCFSMTMPIIISGIILILLGFGGITPVDIPAMISPQNEAGRDTILFANILLFVFFLPNDCNLLLAFVECAS